MSREKLTGSLSTNIYVTCPKCEEFIDLFDIEHLNDEGQLWKVINGRYFKDDRDSWRDLEMDFDCPKCKAELTFDELEY